MSEIARRTRRSNGAIVRGPSAFGGPPRRFGELLWLTASSNSGRATRRLPRLPVDDHPAADLLRRGLHGDARRVRFGEGIENYGPMLILNIVLFQYFQEGPAGDCDRCPRRRAWSARCNSADHDPALGQPDRGVHADSEPACGLPDDPRLRGQPRRSWFGLSVIVPCSRSCLPPAHLDPLGGIRSVRGHRAGLAADLADVLLRVSDPLSDRARAGVASMAGGGKPAGPAARAGSGLGSSILPRPPPRRSRWVQWVACWRPLGLLATTCIFALWLFEREAPRVAEAL